LQVKHDNTIILSTIKYSGKLYVSQTTLSLKYYLIVQPHVPHIPLSAMIGGSLFSASQL